MYVLGAEVGSQQVSLLFLLPLLLLLPYRLSGNAGQILDRGSVNVPPRWASG